MLFSIVFVALGVSGGAGRNKRSTTNSRCELLATTKRHLQRQQTAAGITGAAKLNVTDRCTSDDDPTRSAQTRRQKVLPQRQLWILAHLLFLLLLGTDGNGGGEQVPDGLNQPDLLGGRRGDGGHGSGGHGGGGGGNGLDDSDGSWGGGSHYAQFGHGSGGLDERGLAGRRG